MGYHREPHQSCHLHTTRSRAGGGAGSATMLGSVGHHKSGVLPCQAYTTGSKYSTNL
ncbi:hypothetical protein CY34DRAFT_800101, partial [Suillus luteus UH-Slu-Lm8-n1]